MVALNGHEAGNGGHSQEVTYSHRARLRPEGKLGRSAVAGGTWEAVDERRALQRRRADSVKARRSQRNQDGEG